MPMTPLGGMRKKPLERRTFLGWGRKEMVMDDSWKSVIGNQ
jgi:hypothetical protein